jgi:hypothetical protein
MKIKSKLLLAFGLLVLLMFFTNALGIWLFVNTDTEYSSMVTGTILRHYNISNAIGDLTRIRLNILSRMYSATSSPHSEIIAELYKDRGELIGTFEKNINSYYENIRFDPDLAAVERQDRGQIILEIIDLF